MVNFLWQIFELFGDPQLLEILFVISLFVLPHLLSFLLALFYKKFRFKNFGLAYGLRSFVPLCVAMFSWSIGSESMLSVACSR